MTLHLVRLPVNLRALAAFAVANRASDDDGGYALHLALRRRFGTAGPQPFRVFADGPAAPHLLGYATDKDALADMAALPATDPMLDAVFGEHQIRAMPETWRDGARFAFDVRARPVVRYGGRVREARAGREGAFHSRGGKPAQEMDAYLAACERAGPREDGAPALAREPVYLDWLTRAFGPAAAIEGAEVRQFRRVRSRRARHPSPAPRDGGEPPAAPLGRPQVEGPDALMAGTLTIRYPDAFAQLLARGVGRHAAFGYGMLLLSPPRR